jgi:hypothetical protein
MARRGQQKLRQAKPFFDPFTSYGKKNGSSEGQALAPNVRFLADAIGSEKTRPKAEMHHHHRSRLCPSLVCATIGICLPR